jgi:hypothetical protein
VRRQQINKIRNKRENMKKQEAGEERHAAARVYGGWRAKRTGQREW